MYYMTKKHPQVSNGKIGHLINGIRIIDGLRIGQVKILSPKALSASASIKISFRWIKCLSVEIKTMNE